MKRFLLTLASFLAIVAVIVLSVNGIYLLREQEGWGTMSNLRNSQVTVKDVPEEIQICNFGSSHGLYGFNYEELSEKYNCFNFGLSAQVPSYDLRILQNYKENIAEGAVVILPISYLSFFGESETESEDFASKNKRYYRFLDRDYIKEYDFSTDIWVNTFPSMASGSLITVAKELLLDPNGADAWNVETNATEAAEHSITRYWDHIESRKDESGGRIFNQEEIDSIYDFIELCNERGFTCILITTPYLEEYHSQIREKDPAFYDDFYKVVAQIVSDTGVRYCDYSVDERFIHDYSLFKDSDHLNRIGAKEFVSILEKEVLSELVPTR